MKLEKLNYNDFKALEQALSNLLCRTWQIKDNAIYSGDYKIFTEEKIRRLIKKYNENLLILNKVFPELTKDLN